MANFDGGYANGSHEEDAFTRGGADAVGSSVFVTNLQWWTSDVDLERLCSEYGQVVGIRFIEDKACCKSRGMAVVDFAEPGAAAACIQGLNGRDVNGRSCRVNYQASKSSALASTSGQGGMAMGGAVPGRGGGPPMGQPGRGPRMGGGGRGGGRGPMGMDGGGMGDMSGMLGMMGMQGMHGMMGMGGPMGGMDMGMMGMPGGVMHGMGMPGMMPYGHGMGGMPFKPPPPPGPPPPKREPN